ncbi:hypothetical protein BOO71_0009727 [Deinococcus marmoris]|uniref:Uncharacterized protein n=1 Tax=Deinococcus marmoris TaxID=249408 RepID=A0A1U7NW49_9DEIO|nr:hypothetical protein BOO71_0009727 [Deinococcus marmoris]
MPTAARIAELKLEPVKGNDDAAYLHEVHRRFTATDPAKIQRQLDD